MTLKFFVSSSLSHCSAAANKKFPLQPEGCVNIVPDNAPLLYLPLPLRVATGLPAEPRGAKKNKCTCGFTCDTTGCVT